MMKDVEVKTRVDWYETHRQRTDEDIAEAFADFGKTFLRPGCGVMWQSLDALIQVAKEREALTRQS